MPRGARTRIAKNIYKDAIGLAAVIETRGLRQEIRFPKGTPLDEIRRTIDDTRHRLQMQRAQPDAGTLDAIVAAYLEREPEPRKTDRRFLLQPWLDALGAKRFQGVTRAQLQRVTSDWKRAGLSGSRINKRISALRVVWSTTAPDSPHPILQIDKYAEPPAVTRGVSLDLVARILEHVEAKRTAKNQPRAAGPDSLGRARLAVLAWTGQPPSRIMAVTPADVRWNTTPPELYVQPRRKGKGSSDAWIPLTPNAVDALRHFFAIGAQGPFSVSTLARIFKRAVKKTQAALRKERKPDDANRLAGMRLYDLRHSLLTALAIEAQDIYAVKEYAGHASLQTTIRYMRGAASPRMREGIQRLTAALQGRAKDEAGPVSAVPRKRAKLSAGKVVNRPSK